MTAPHRRRSPTGFFVVFGVIALLIAGLLSYLASAKPDGLDSVTLHGCQVTRVDGTEQLSGECIAQNARDNALAGSPLADYTVQGKDGLVGVAGVIGMLVTLTLAGGLFWLARPRQERRAGKRSAGKI
ncbi:MAG: PDGLE domain-containing protein [Actinobacteria bacterium]|nr:PDGLE domain-containing protein [Actinomycetota bacterium]